MAAWLSSATWGLDKVTTSFLEELIPGTAQGCCVTSRATWSQPQSSEVPRLLFQTFIFTDGEDEELKKQARESVALVPLCV